MNNNYRFDCRYFNGYKPCARYKTCEKCDRFSPMGTKVLIISLEAMGSVLRTTTLLKPIKRKYPQSFITWVTKERAAAVLENNPYIDRVMPFRFESYAVLQAQSFDILMNADKSKEAASLANIVTADFKKRQIHIRAALYNPLVQLPKKALPVQLRIVC